MLTWVKQGKGSSSILFLVSILTLFSALAFVLLHDLNSQEYSRIVEVLSTQGVKAYALFSLIAVIFLGAIVVQLFFGSMIMHAISKIIFRIPISFELFYQVMKIFNIFLAFAIAWLIMIDINSLVLSVILNPFIIFGFVIMFYLIVKFSHVHWFKPFLFVIFNFITYLILINSITGGS